MASPPTNAGTSCRFATCSGAASSRTSTCTADSSAATATAARDVRSELRAAGFSKKLIKANVKRLDRLLRTLDWRPAPSVWSEYGPTDTYSAQDAERKAAFVRRIARSRPWKLVWDLGCNDGFYSRIAAESAEYVVAMDADHGVVERLYRSLKAEANASILPLMVDVVDPSPSLGWRGSERKALPERCLPHLTSPAAA